MPLSKIRRTDRGKLPLSVYEEALGDIINGSSIRAAAKKYNLCHVSLTRFKKKKGQPINDRVTMGYRA